MNFRVGRRRLSFEFKNPWALLGGNSFSSGGGPAFGGDFNPLGEFSGGSLAASFSTSSSAEADENSKKPEPFTKLRSFLEKVRTYFKENHSTLNDHSFDSIEEILRDFQEKIK